MRRAPAASLLALAVLAEARPASAQEAEIERFFQQISALPNVVIAELAEALKKARGVGIELVRTRFEHVATAPMESRRGAAVTPFLGTDTLSNRAVVPLPVSSKAAVVGAISHESLSFRHGGRAAFPAERVHALRGQIAFLRELSDTWRFVSGVELGVLSDLGGVAAGEALGVHDFQVGGLVLFDVKLGDIGTISFGSAVSSTLGVPAPLPVLRAGVEYEGFAAEMTVPTEIRASYAPAAGVVFGVRGALSGNSYHLVAQDQSLSHRGIFVGPFLGAEIFQGMTFHVAGGLAPWRQLRLVADDGEEIENLDPLTAPFVRLELDFRL
jgi:hypothetical protein